MYSLKVYNHSHRRELVDKSLHGHRVKDTVRVHQRERVRENERKRNTKKPQKVEMPLSQTQINPRAKEELK